MCLLQVNWFKNSMVKAIFADIVNSDGDGICLDTSHVFCLWQAQLKEMEDSIDEEVGDANV